MAVATGALDMAMAVVPSNTLARASLKLVATIALKPPLASPASPKHVATIALPMPDELHALPHHVEAAVLPMPEESPALPQLVSMVALPIPAASPLLAAPDASTHAAASVPPLSHTSACGTVLSQTVLLLLLTAAPLASTHASASAPPLSHMHTCATVLLQMVPRLLRMQHAHLPTVQRIRMPAKQVSRASEIACSHASETGAATPSAGVPWLQPPLSRSVGSPMVPDV
mmetsp:Transcript_44704/g.143189  ORF Transcript_44704/g.143189 Transcript_44704/m.143189 type:complete len:229 (-) Transcript_44704:205-891(-)